jgi:hypothetical protein
MQQPEPLRQSTRQIRVAGRKSVAPARGTPAGTPLLRSDPSAAPARSTLPGARPAGGPGAAPSGRKGQAVVVPARGRPWLYSRQAGNNHALKPINRQQPPTAVCVGHDEPLCCRSFPCPAKPVLPNLHAARMKRKARRGLTLVMCNVRGLAAMDGLAVANPWA